MKTFRDLANVDVQRQNVNSNSLLNSVEDYVYDILKTGDDTLFQSDINREVLVSYLRDCLVSLQSDGEIENFKLTSDYQNSSKQIFTISITYKQSHMLNRTSLVYRHIQEASKYNSQRNFQFTV